MRWPLQLTECDTGSRIGIQVLSGLCGNSPSFWLDRERVAGLARELFAAYGLQARPFDLEVEGVAARLDGYDARARAGFVLLPRERASFSAPAPTPEPAAQALDAGEQRRVRELGIRLHAAKQDSYHHVDPDDPMPTLAYLLGILDFLDATTDGPDLDPQAWLRRDPTRHTVPNLDAKLLPAAKEVHREEKSSWALLPRAGKLVLDVAGASGGEPAKVMALVAFQLYWAPEQGGEISPQRPRFTLVQRSPRGELRVESGRPAFLAGAGFDASRPFRIEVALPAGSVHLGPELTVRAY